MTVWERIYRQLKEQIDGGEYQPGDRLPSIRQYAEITQSNKITVKKAYDRLKEDGVIENTVGKGSFVKFPQKMETQDSVLSFTRGSLSETLFPARAAEGFADFVREEGTALWSGAPVQGVPGLIKTLSRVYGVPEARTMVISGGQQGLNLTARLFGSAPDETMAFEDPTYPGAISLFRPRMMIPMTPEGPDPRAFRSLPWGKLKAFYTISGIHNPTGYFCSDDRKREIAALAEEMDFLVVEDETQSEFRPFPGIRYQDLIPHRTITLKSLSKVSAPGIRLGMLTAPEGIFDRLLYHKYTSDLGSSALAQHFLARFIGSELWEEYLRTVTETLHVRRTLLLQILSNFPGLVPVSPSGGFGLWIRGDRSIPESPVWMTGRRFSFSPEHHSAFRLAYMGLSGPDFSRGIVSLEQELSRHFGG